MLNYDKANRRSATWCLYRLRAMPLAVMAAIFCCSAFADPDPDQVVRPHLTYSTFYDNNLFRIPDDEIPFLNGAPLSDTYRRGEGGFDFDKKIGQQHLTASLNVNRTSFSRFTQLDNDGQDLSAQWNWHLGKHVEGNVGTSYSKTLTSFTEVHDQELNVQTQRRRFFDASWLFHPSWRVRSSFSRSEVNYSLSSQSVNDRNVDETQLGLDYLASSSSTVGLQLGHVRGELPNFQQFGPFLIDNSFVQNEFKAKIDWWVSGKSRLQFLGGWVQRSHDSFSSRDFNGINARLIATWMPTGKIGAVLNSWREIGAVDDLTASYTLNKGLSLGPTWDLSAKLRLEGLLKYERRDYNGSVEFIDRSDTLRNLSLALTYVPYQHFQVQTSVYHELRGSNVAGVAYHDTGASLTARYDF